MPTNIDENVVKMSFDNAQFEQGVKQSLKSIEDLKNSLKFNKMEDSLSGLEDLADKMSNSLEGLADSAQKVANTFTPLGKIINKTLDELTGPIAKTISEVMNWSTGFAGMGAGFEKYDKYTRAVQTITNATKQSVDEVSASLDKLMKYTDETSYDFAEMVTSIGKFTSVGVDLKEAEEAMEGIANWAAKSGAQKAEANRAMYNISQAMGAGALKLIDWKSIENANMATKEFKETAIATAEAMGTLQKGVVTYQNFNETLKEGWLSSDVLLNVLRQYGDTTTEFGLAAFHAAQEALTFTDAIDALKDAISSGWMKTLELLFGNLDEARVMWTNVANGLIEFVDVLTGWRNELLEGWHALGGYNAMVEAATNIWQTFMNIVLGVKEAIANVFPPATAENLVAFTNKIKQASDNLLKSFGLDTINVIDREVKTLVDHAEELNMALKKGDKGEAVKFLQERLYHAGFLSDKKMADGIYGPKTAEAIKKLQKAVGVEVTGQWDKATRSATIANKKFVESEIMIEAHEYENTEEVIEKYKEIENTATKLNKILKKGDKGQYVKSLQQQLIKMGLLTDKNAADGIYGPKTEAAVKKLQQQLGVEMTGAWDHNTRKAAQMSESFQEIVEKERKVLKETEGLTEPMGRLQSMVSGIASVFKTAWNIAKGAFQVVKGVLHIFDPFVDAVTRAGAAVGDMFTNFNQHMENGDVIEGWVQRITTLLDPLAKAIEWVADGIHHVIDEYAYFLYGFNLENSFQNFFNFIVYSMRQNSILGPIIGVLEWIVDKILWAKDIAIYAISETIAFFKNNIGILFSGGMTKEGKPEENGLVVTLLKIFYTLQAIGGMIIDFLANVFVGIFDFNIPGAAAGSSKIAIVLGGLLNIVNYVAQGLLIAVTLIGIGLGKLLGVAQKFVGPLIAVFAPMFDMVNGDIKSGAINGLGDLLRSLWMAFGSTTAGKYVQAGIDRIKEFFNQAALYLEQKFPGLIGTFKQAWSGLKGFFTWDTNITFLDNLKVKFEMLKTGLISIVLIIRDKLIELKDNIASLFQTNEETGNLNLFDKVTNALTLFAPVVDKFIAVKDKFVNAWNNFIGVTKDDNAETVAKSGPVSVLDAMRSFFSNIATTDWAAMIKPALYALAAYTVYSGVKSIRNLTETINKGGVMGIIFGSGDDDDDSWTGKAMKIAQSALMVAGALAVLAVIPADKALIGIVLMGGMLSALVGIMIWFDKAELSDSKFPKTLESIGKALVGFGQSIFWLAIGISIMMGIVKDIDKNGGIGVFIGAIALIGGFLISLGALEYILTNGFTLHPTGDRGGGSGESKIAEICKGVVILVAALGLMINTLKGLTKDEYDKVRDAVLLISLFLLELGAIEYLLTNGFSLKPRGGGGGGGDDDAEEEEEEAEKKVSGILELCVGLMVVVKAFTNLINELRKIKPDENDRVAESFAYIATFLAELGAIVVLLGAFGKGFTSSLGIGVELGVLLWGFTKVINAFTEAVYKIRNVDWKVITAFAAGIDVGMGILAGVVLAFGHVGLDKVFLGEVGFVALCAALAAGVYILAEVGTNILNDFTNVLQIIGVRLYNFSYYIEQVNWESIDKAVEWLKTMPNQIFTFVANAGRNAEAAMYTMQSLWSIGYNLMLYSEMISSASATGIAGSVMALYMIEFAKLLADEISKVNVPENATDGKLNILGASLLIYSTELSMVEDGLKQSANALQLVKDAKDIADVIQTISVTDTGVGSLVAVGAALKLYYQALNSIGKTDEEGNPLEMEFVPEDLNISSESIAKVFEGLKKAMPKDETLQGLAKYDENSGSGAVSMSSVAVGIEAIGGALKSYAENISDIDPTTVAAANSTIEEFEDLDTYLNKPNVAGAGESLDQNISKISAFSNHITTLGTALGLYGSSIGTLETKYVKNANDVLDKFVELDKYVNGDKKGVLQRIFDFFGNLTNLNAGTVNYMDASSLNHGMDQTDYTSSELMDQLKQETEVINKLNEAEDEAADAVANATFKPKQTDPLKRFGENIEYIGQSLGNYGTEINKLDPDQMKIADDLLTHLTNLSDVLPKFGGAVQLLNGRAKGLGEYGDEISLLGLNLMNFQNAINGLRSSTDGSKLEQFGDALSLDKLSGAFDVMERMMDWGKKYYDDNAIGTLDDYSEIPLKFQYVYDAISKILDDFASLSARKFDQPGIFNADLTFTQSLNQVGEYLSGFIANGIENSESLIYDSIIELLKKASLTAGTRVEKEGKEYYGIQQCAYNILKALGDKLSGYKDNSGNPVIGGLKEAIQGALTMVESTIEPELISFGEFVAEGIMQGINNKAPGLGTLMTELAEKYTVAPYQKGVEVNSPSRKFEWVGEMCALGLKLGIIKNKDLVTDSMLDLGTASIDQIVAALDPSKTKEIMEGALETISATISKDEQKYNTKLTKEMLLMSGYLENAEDFDDKKKRAKAFNSFRSEILDDNRKRTGWGKIDSIRLQSKIMDQYALSGGYSETDLKAEQYSIGQKPNNKLIYSVGEAAAQAALNYKEIHEKNKIEEAQKRLHDRLASAIGEGPAQAALNYKEIHAQRRAAEAEKRQIIDYVGDEVAAIQEILNYVNKSNLIVDGIYDYATQLEVKRFQKLNGLAETGIWNEATNNAVDAAIEKRNKEVEAAERKAREAEKKKAREEAEHKAMEGKEVVYSSAGNTSAKDRKNLDRSVMKAAGWKNTKKGQLRTIGYTYGIDNKTVEIKLTPVTENGEVLSHEALQAYADMLGKEALKSQKAAVKADKKENGGLGLLISYREIMDEKEVKKIRDKEAARQAKITAKLKEDAKETKKVTDYLDQVILSTSSTIDKRKELIKMGELSRGSSGEDVKILQEYINWARKNKKNDPLTVDGIFGPKTEAALKEMQSILGTEQTGKLDKSTKESIDELVKSDSSYIDFRKDQLSYVKEEAKIRQQEIKAGKKVSGTKVSDIYTMLGNVDKKTFKGASVKDLMKAGWKKGDLKNYSNNESLYWRQYSGDIDVDDKSVEVQFRLSATGPDGKPLTKKELDEYANTILGYSKEGRTIAVEKDLVSNGGKGLITEYREVEKTTKAAEKGLETTTEEVRQQGIKNGIIKESTKATKESTKAKEKEAKAIKKATGATVDLTKVTAKAKKVSKDGQLVLGGTDKEARKAQIALKNAKLGDKGDNVKNLQSYLNSLPSTTTKLSTDGIFGPKTQAAVKDFQKMYGLGVTGELDNKTIDKLSSTLGKYTKVVKKASKTRFKEGTYTDSNGKYQGLWPLLNSNSDLAKITKTLKKGDSGEQVAALQRFLNANLKKQIKVTGKYDAETEDAVNRLQGKYGLFQNGQFDEDTIHAASRRQATTEKRTEANKQYEKNKIEEDAYNKKKEDAVLRLQNFLNKYGYLPSGSYEEGVMDAATIAAYRNFANANGINPDEFETINKNGEKVYDLTDFNENAWNTFDQQTKGMDIKYNTPDVEYQRNFKKDTEEAQARSAEVLARQKELELAGFLNENQYTPGIYDKSTKEAEEAYNKTYEHFAYGDAKLSAEDKENIDKAIKEVYGTKTGYLDAMFNQLWINEGSGKARKQDPEWAKYVLNRHKQAEKNQAFRNLYGFDYDSTKSDNRVYLNDTGKADIKSNYVKAKSIIDKMVKYGFLADSDRDDGQKVKEAFAAFRQAIFGYASLPALTDKIEFKSDEENILLGLAAEYGGWDSIMKHLGVKPQTGQFKAESWTPAGLSDTRGIGSLIDTSQYQIDIPDVSELTNALTGEGGAFDVSALKSQIAEMINPALTGGLADGIKQATESITDGSWIGGTMDAVTDAMETANGALEGFESDNSIMGSIIDYISPDGNDEKLLNGAGESVVNYFWDGAKSKGKEILGNFGFIGDGIYKALFGEDDAKDAGETAADNANEGFTDAEKINSPSKVWEEFGKNLIQGLANGILNNEQLAINAIDHLNKSMIKHAKDMLEAISISMVGDDGSSFTFRPVLDDSALGSGEYKTGNGKSNNTGFFNIGTTVGEVRDIAQNIQNDIRSLKTSMETGHSNIVSQFQGLNNHLNDIDRDLKNLKVYIDKTKLVGAIGPDIDKYLGKQNIYGRRSN